VRRVVCRGSGGCIIERRGVRSLAGLAVCFGRIVLSFEEGANF
jgi:hypothetical protein